jgi:colicin import membrane protein
MNDRMPTAFLTSLTLHGAVVAVMLLMAYTAGLEKRTETKVFELVQGEGDNFAATEAPLLGVPGGIKVNIPTPPAPRPTPQPPTPEPKVVELEPVTPEISPPTPTPAPTPPPPTPTKAPPDAKSKAPVNTTKTIAEQMKWEQIKRESAAKQKLAKEKAAEKKRLDAERAEAARREKLAAKSVRIDSAGIAKGVLEGSAANTKGGAGGKALTRTEGPVLDAYFAMLRERLLAALRSQAGLSDTLSTEVEFRLNADGSIIGAKVIGPSGNAEFDRAVLDVFSRVRMPGRPDGRGDVHTIRIRAKDLEG